MYTQIQYTFNIDPNKNKHQFENYNYIYITLRGVFLALLLFCASFLAPYIGCNYQSILKQNYYTRYILLFLIIYFSINLVDPNVGTKENPFMTIIKSIVVFFTFLILNNLHITSIILVLILFAILIFTSRYYEYYKETTVNKNKSSFTQDILLVIQFVLSISIIGILGLSFFIQDKKTSPLFLLSRCKL